MTDTEFKKLSPEDRRKAVRCLRRVVYYRLRMWDEANKAEKHLGCDVDTAGDGLDYLASGIDDPKSALKLSARTLVRTLADG